MSIATNYSTVRAHPMSWIDDDVVIGEGVAIWQFASVVRGAVIGAYTSVGASATVDGATVGVRCRIQSGARLFAGCVVEDSVFIGPNAVVCNDYFPRNEKTGFYPDQYSDRPCVVIKHNASIGANAVIMPGVTVGRLAMVPAGSKVTADVPDNHLWTSDGKCKPLKSGHVERMRFARG